MDQKECATKLKSSVIFLLSFPNGQSMYYESASRYYREKSDREVIRQADGRGKSGGEGEGERPAFGADGHGAATPGHQTELGMERKNIFCPATKLNKFKNWL